MLLADPASGHNELVYRDAASPPVVLASATVTPAAVTTLDPGLRPCAVCGDTFVEPPETCDDGNQDDGDGCSSTCQVEAAACDADGDGDIDVLDLAGIESEIFDGDGDRTLDVGDGTFPGTIGADSNDDGRISSPDLSRCIEVLDMQ
jgi:cysteine-rich repeat protein